MRMNDKPYSNRKHPAHHPPIERHNKPTILFLTICTHKRKKILASDSIHESLLKAWNTADHWLIGRTSSCQTTSTSFANPPGGRPFQLPNGQPTEKDWSPNRAPTFNPYGSAIVGTPSYDNMKTIPKNGPISATIPCGQDGLRMRTTGCFKVKSIICPGDQDHFPKFANRLDTNSLILGVEKSVTICSHRMDKDCKP